MKFLNLAFLSNIYMQIIKIFLINRIIYGKLTLKKYLIKKIKHCVKILIYFIEFY